jgi:hypothetical protein
VDLAAAGPCAVAEPVTTRPHRTKAAARSI